MPRMQLVPLRQLPMGNRRRSLSRWALGQDEGDDSDFLDTSYLDDSSTPSFDVTSPYNAAPSTPDLTSNAYTAPIAPDITAPASTVYYGAGPAAPGETVIPTQTTDLSQLILTGQLAPPSGSGLTSAQAAQIAAAGGTANDIDAVLSGQTNASTVLNALKAGATGLTALAQLTSRLQASATPTTIPTGAAGSTIGSTSTASPLSALTSATIIPGIPNWVVGAGGLLAVAAIASLAGGGGKR